MTQENLYLWLGFRCGQLANVCGSEELIQSHHWSVVHRLIPQLSLLVRQLPDSAPLAQTLRTQADSIEGFFRGLPDQLPTEEWQIAARHTLGILEDLLQNVVDHETNSLSQSFMWGHFLGDSRRQTSFQRGQPGTWTPVTGWCFGMGYETATATENSEWPFADLLLEMVSGEDSATVVPPANGPITSYPPPWDGWGRLEFCLRQRTRTLAAAVATEVSQQVETDYLGLRLGHSERDPIYRATHPQRSVYLRPQLFRLLQQYYRARERGLNRTWLVEHWNEIGTGGTDRSSSAIDTAHSALRRELRRLSLTIEPFRRGDIRGWRLAELVRHQE